MAKQQMVDRFGREIFVGCTVAYPGRARSSTWLATGRVVEVDDGAGRERPHNWPGRLKLEGGSHGSRENDKELGVRWIGYNIDHVVVVG
jgi:hypothetical protein